MSDPSIARELAARIRAARVALGLSAEEVAQRAGLSSKYVRDLEEARIGSHGPGVFLMRRLASVLGTSVDALLGEAGGIDLDGLAFLDGERVERILGAGRISDLDDLIAPAELCFGAEFSSGDRIVSAAEFRETLAKCQAHYAKLAARERRRR